ncbi:MAG TPA: hypothetical protein VFX35_02675 [Solirubrobacterales bacterium]|nr:hypothetical protein [Solirubrobacterales bacterium]
MKRTAVVLVFLVAASAVPAAAAPAANVLYPATYVGTAATGGSLEFDVSPEGAEITRFALTKVPLPPCGTITGQTTRKVAIVSDSFSNALGLLHFGGSFPALGQAQGTFSYHRKDGTCDSEEISWTATAPLPLPAEPSPPPPPPIPAPPPADETPPETRITSGPSGVRHREWAVFRFSSTEAGSTFRCRLEGEPWRACESPRVFRRLREERHVFRVEAIDAAGNVDVTPARRGWRIKLR